MRSGGKLWAGGAFRSADGLRRVFAPGEVEFAPLREWRSPRTGASYPVVWRIRAGELEITVEPLMDDQENDTRASVGTIYWEGAVRALRDKNPWAEAISSSPATSTLIVSFGPNLPSRIALASGFSICDWIARFSGRAP